MVFTRFFIIHFETIDYSFVFFAEKVPVAPGDAAEVEDIGILESLDADVDPEEDLEHFVAILVESLSRLGKLPEAIEQIKAKMQSQLMAVISR